MTSIKSAEADPIAHEQECACQIIIAYQVYDRYVESTF